MTITGIQRHETISTERLLVRTQQVAGAVFATFVLFHLSNIFIAPLGIEAFNGYQRLLQQVYQFPLIEVGVVLGPLVCHAVAGIWLAILRRGRRGRRSLRARLHTWAGFFVLVVIGGHVLATRGASFFFGVFPEFQGLSFSLWYALAYFYPYYFLLAVAGFCHASNGLRMVLSLNGVNIPRRVQSIATAVVAVLVALSLLSLGGFLFDVGNPADNDFARLAETLFGIEI